MKWRKAKKMLKKNVLPKMIGMYIGIEPRGGCPMKIVGVKAHPAGGKNVRYTYSVEPMDKEMFEKSMREQEQERVMGNSYSLFFDIPKPKGKELLQLFRW